MKTNKWQPANGSSYDNVKSLRNVGRLNTIASYKRLKKAVSSLNIGRQRCGHDFDCCGCLCSQYAEITYNNGEAIVILEQSFNY